MLLNDRIWSLGSETILSFSPWATAFQIVWHDFEDEKTPIQEKHPLKNLLQPKKKLLIILGPMVPSNMCVFVCFSKFYITHFSKSAINPMGFDHFFPWEPPSQPFHHIEAGGIRDEERRRHALRWKATSWGSHGFFKKGMGIVMMIYDILYYICYIMLYMYIVYIINIRWLI